MQKAIERYFENPFEKTKVEDLNDNYELIAYLFAMPQEEVYSKLINRDNYRIVGGWGSGKTMLLKYISFETQIAALKKEIEKKYKKIENQQKLLKEEILKANFIGIYIRMGLGGFKPFLKPGGEFKEGGENLFGHYFNLFVLERILSVILYGKNKGVFDISPEEENNLGTGILSKFRFSFTRNPQMGFTSSSDIEILTLQSVENKVQQWRLEIETFLNTRDLEKNLSYDTQLIAPLTSIETFLNEVIQEIDGTIKDVSKKRLYILLDECDLISVGEQKVINTIIKRRFTTMTFKLASRPPDIKTQKTIYEDVGLTDREIKKLYLDEMYDPTSKDYKQLCYKVAQKRLEHYKYPITDIRKILGKYKVEDEVSRDKIEQYLREKYPNKQRIKNNFKEVYKDFKVAAAFQILKQERGKKKYAGFDTFVMLSSGIMLHFLELCGQTFAVSFNKFIVHDKSRNITFKQIPLPLKIQHDSACTVSKNFYRDIKGRAESLKDTSVEMEFGEKIQLIVSALSGIFREKLMTFNEPEAAKIEIPEGISALDNSLSNPVQQIFNTAVSISVFQEVEPYLPQRFGGIRPPTYILNRIFAPYPEPISPRPRWRTQFSAMIFNKILSNPNELRSEVLGRKKKKKEKLEEKKVKILPEKQLTLPLFQVSESMPVISYLSNVIKNNPFKDKTLIILLHFLKDLIPFIDACKKLGASPSHTILFYKHYQYPNKKEIENYLKNKGYDKIYPLTEVDTVLRELWSEQIKNIIVIEDGGHIVPKLHEKDLQNLAKVTLGAVEQTTRGVRNNEKIGEFLFPIISIPGSRLKNTFEPPHVARAVINNIQKLLPDKNYSGRKALVIGFGYVGKQIALQLRDTLRMQVSIHDLDDSKLVEAKEYGIEVVRYLEEEMREKYLIVGATGETIIKRSEILAMEHNVYLISASSEQWEFCISELEALSSEKSDFYSNDKKIGTRYKIRNTEKFINLIADGYPINFWGSESMPNEVSDLIMSLILISAVKISTHWSSLPKKIDYNIVNELEKQYELSKIYLEYHK